MRSLSHKVVPQERGWQTGLGSAEGCLCGLRASLQLAYSNRSGVVSPSCTTVIFFSRKNVYFYFPNLKLYWKINYAGNFLQKRFTNSICDLGAMPTTARHPIHYEIYVSPGTTSKFVLLTGHSLGTKKNSQEK